MVAVVFGNTYGMQISAYIPMEKCQPSDALVETYIENRMATIASSLVGVYGVNLGLDGNYCESFVHWLAGAAALSHNVYCDSETCGHAVKYHQVRSHKDVQLTRL